MWRRTDWSPCCIIVSRPWKGRADIKARLLTAEEEISLSTDKEMTLYYIAQEALNNVLRHARAKSVLVTLKQGRKNVILEIRDDGVRF